MKKRVLSALMAVGLACSLVVTAFATADVSATPAPTAAVESQNTETESSDPAAEADPTETPAETPAATQEPTPAPEESTPAPSEEPASSATPEPTAEPSAAPDDTVTATPTPTPEATAAPTPEATEEPAAAEPTAEPEATAEPAETETQSAEVEIDGQLVNVFVDIPVGAFEEGVTPVLHAEAVSAEDADKAAETVAEQTGATFDSMMVLDVYFTDGDNTDEIEPALPVSVRFELPEAALPENIDASTLTVHHIAEEKDEAGNTVTDENGEAVVNVETVATATTTDDVEGVIALSATAAEKTEAGEDVARIDDLPELQAEALVDNAEEPGVVAAFEVESFSTFVLTYTQQGGQGSGSGRVTVHLVDENGQELNIDTEKFKEISTMYSPTDFGQKWLSNQWISIEELASTWAYVTEGYTYQGAYRSRDGGGVYNQIYWIRFNDNTQDRRSQGWRYSRNSSSSPYGASGDGSISNLYLVYAPVTQIDDTSITIDDTVSSDGKLTAIYSNTSSELYYVWEKSETGSQNDWNEIRRLRVTEDRYNLTENGKQLNAALEVVNDEKDVGGWWYRVSVYNSKAAYDEGDEPLATSAAMQLGYYDELRNGSFEDPDVTALTNRSNYQYPLGTDDLVWKTTGSDRQIELVYGPRTTSGDYGRVDAVQDDSGDQFAELNAQAEGALYQDVLTVPGSTLNWQFYHRGRGGVDSMSLVIAPADEVEDITTQEELKDLIDDIKHQRNGKTEENGYYLFDASDGTDSWQRYASNRGNGKAYTVPSDQYLTRFFFVATNAARSNTEGNFLDRVLFTTNMLPPDSGSANLTITKVVEGMSEEDIKDYTVTIHVGDDEFTLGDSLHPFRAQNDGTYIATLQTTVNNIDSNASAKVTVTENATEPDGYKHTGSTVAVNGESAVSGTRTEIELEDQGSGAVVFTNSYTSTTTTLTLTKTFEGLSDAEVEYLIFREDGFGWDINYCTDEPNTTSGDKTYMAPGSDLEGITMPGSSDAMKNGGDYKVVASEYLTGAEGKLPENGSYQDEKSKATLTKDASGNWTFSITLDVPVCEENSGHFFTVYEQHQEVPGYAKINDSNAEYTIEGSGYEGENANGTGKFVDIGCENNIYEDMDSEVEVANSNFTGDDKLENEAIDAGYFTRLHITGPTTISFTNHYTGELDVTKQLGDDNKWRDAANKEFTLTLAPAHLDKLDLNSATEIQHGLAGKTIHYTIDSGAEQSVEIAENGTITVKIKAEQTLHFLDLPAIQWQVSEDVTASENVQDGYTLTASLSDANGDNTNGYVVSDASHWNGYGTGDEIGATKDDDGIASVDSARRDNAGHQVDASSVASVTVTNTYTPDLVTLTVNKTVAGSMGDTSGKNAFTFHLTLSKEGEDGNNLDAGEITYTIDEAEEQKMKHNPETGYTFELSHDQTAEIQIPYGYTAKLEEVKAGGYEVYSRQRTDADEDISGTWTDDTLDTMLTSQHFSKNNVVSDIVMTASRVCDFVNFRPVVPPTGLESNHTTPYGLMVGAAGVAGAALVGSVVVRRRRRRQE